MHDLVIKGALILDGLGSPPFTADLGVTAGRISSIEKSLSGKQIVRADGLALMPGIIDNHTHYDAQITWDPRVAPSPSLGVTTAVIGNCGFTIAPCRATDRELIMRNLTQVEGMSLDVLRAGIRWDFETFPQYLDMLERRGSAINIAAFAGHSAIRTYVMGDEATQRSATPAEVASMKKILAEAMQAGAVGFSTSTSPAHNGEGGKPMPSRLADETEMRELVGSLKRGVFMLTKGGHTPIPFLEELAAATGRPVVIAALLHNSTNPDSVFKDLHLIQQANDRGRRLLGAISCCPLSMDFTLHSPYVIEGLESWKPALPLKGDAFRKIISSRGFRDAIRAELSKPAHFRLFNGEWDKVEVVASQRSVAQLARETNQDPLDFMLDLALREDLDTVFNALLLNSDEEAVGRMLRHPCSLVSLSDAGAHLTFFNDAGFGLHLLGHWVRERKAFDLGFAAKKLTGEPARIFGIRERGALKPGFHADLLLFDPAKVGRGPKRHVNDLPGGHARLGTDALGVHGVWVNGAAPESLKGSLLRDFA
jgi:N-acyl-D-aspartate/D-glutamate deacylase